MSQLITCNCNWFLYGSQLYSSIQFLQFCNSHLYVTLICIKKTITPDYRKILSAKFQIFFTKENKFFRMVTHFLLLNNIKSINWEQNNSTYAQLLLQLLFSSIKSNKLLNDQLTILQSELDYFFLPISKA